MKAGEKRIVRVTVHRELDGDPDLSWIGEYDNEPGPNAIDRKERGDMGRGEYRYFNPTLSGKDTGNPESPAQDYERMEAYNAGDWCMMGVWAEAEIILTGNTVQRIRSGGLWGIESDSGETYFGQIADEQMAELRGELEAIGFTSEQIHDAFTDCDHDG